MRSHCGSTSCPLNSAFINRRDSGLWLICFAQQTAQLLFLLAALSCVALAQLPGDPAPTGKPPDTGSVLIYNYYSSSIPSTDEDTVIELTNNHKSVGSFVHLFFIEVDDFTGSSCTMEDTVICLVRRDTVTFRISEFVAGVKGYIVVVATDSNGLPINFNFLSGHEEIKLASGHKADFDAVAIRAIASTPAPAPGPSPYCNFNCLTTLNFDGIHYGKVPRVLELEPVYSVVDSNSTLLIVNSLNGESLLSGMSALSPVQGIFTNLDTGNQYPFTGSALSCQLNQILSNAFPSITPVFSAALPAKQEGNLKIWATADLGIFGAVINFNAAKKGKKFNSGDNLRAVTLTTASLMIFVFPAPAGC